MWMSLALWLANTLTFPSHPQRWDSALLWQMNLWSGALKRNEGLGDPRNYFFPFFSLLWLRHPNLITKGYNFPGKRLCWPWVFTTSVVFLLGCTACWNTAQITSEQDIPKASSCKMRTKPASACGQFTSNEEEKVTIFWKVINILWPHCICQLSSTSTTFLCSCKQERVLTAQAVDSLKERCMGKKKKWKHVLGRRVQICNLFHQLGWLTLSKASVKTENYFSLQYSGCSGYKCFYKVWFLVVFNKDNV